MTVNGIITIKRTILVQGLNRDCCENIREIVPLGELLQIDRLPFKMTRSMMLEVSYMGQMLSSYREASKELYKKFGYEISTSLVRDVTIFVGNLVFESDKNKAVKTMKNIINSIDDKKPKIKGILYILMDGAALNTRIQDKNGSTWRENKLGVSFASINIIKRGSSEKSGNTIRKKEYTAYIGSSEEFAKFVYQIAINQGYGKYEKTIILSDGATWIRSMCEEMFPDAVQILDKFHLDENIYNFSKAIFHNNEKKYKPWAEMIIKHISEQEIDEALKEINKYDMEKLSAGIVNLQTYITNNKSKIDYKTYKEKGYLIGSGPIESGNKIVLQKRLKQSGMRWSPKTAQPILSLRAKVESGLWNNDVKPLVMNYIG